MTLLEIKSFSATFSNGFSAVKNANLTVNPTQFVALIGTSGSGKSTLAQAILKLQSMHYTGEICWQGKNLLQCGEEELQTVRGQEISMIFQEPMTALNPLQKVGAQIAEVFEIHHQKYTKQDIYQLLTTVELKNESRIYNSYPFELSGGQRQRILIAMAIALRPKLLIADEPTTALDPVTQEQILKLLQKLQQQFQMAVLLVSHDLRLVQRFADKTYLMRLGEMINVAEFDTATVFSPNPCLKTNKVVLEVKQVNVRYKNFWAVKNASFCLRKGETIGIIGGSGSGKTSLANALLRLIPATGKVWLNGTDFFALSNAELKKKRPEIQIVFQDPALSLNPRLLVKDIIQEGLIANHTPKSQQSEKVRKILQAVHLDSDILTRYPHELSGGQRTRVALARALVLSPSVLILDEVTAALDTQTRQSIIQLLLRLQQQFELGYIFISHDISLIQQIAHTVYEMKDGVLTREEK